MRDYAPARPRTPSRKANISAGIPLPLIELIDNLSEETSTNRSRVVEAALTVGLPIVVERFRAEKAAADQPLTVKE